MLKRRLTDGFDFDWVALFHFSGSSFFDLFLGEFRAIKKPRHTRKISITRNSPDSHGQLPFFHGGEPVFYSGAFSLLDHAQFTLFGTVLFQLSELISPRYSIVVVIINNESGIVNSIFEEKFALSSYVPKTSQKNFDTKNDAETDNKI